MKQNIWINYIIRQNRCWRWKRSRRQPGASATVDAWCLAAWMIATLLSARLKVICASLNQRIEPGSPYWSEAWALPEGCAEWECWNSALLRPLTRTTINSTVWCRCGVGWPHRHPSIILLSDIIDCLHPQRPWPAECNGQLTPLLTTLALTIGPVSSFHPLVHHYLL